MPLFTYGLGDAVRKLRELKGETLRTLAKKAGVAYTAIGRIENGGANFDHGTLERIAKALDTSVADLHQHTDPVFISGDHRELLTVFGELAPARQQFVLAAARREREAQRRGELSQDAATSADQAKKATG